MRYRCSVFAAALWWGSLTTVGFFAVPLLFLHLPTPALAGNAAARLFSAQTWVSAVCGLILLLNLKQKGGTALVQRSSEAMLFIVAGMLLALLVEFAVAPRILLREQLALWHSVASAMLFAQWLCAGTVLWLWTSPAGPARADQV